jgi:hypothetical protein
LEELILLTISNERSLPQKKTFTIGFSDTPDWTFKVQANFFSARLTDYYIASNEISVYANLVAIGLYIYFIRKIKQKPIEEGLFSDLILVERES